MKLPSNHMFTRFVLFVLLLLPCITNANSVSKFVECKAHYAHPELNNSLCAIVQAPLNYFANTNHSQIRLFVRKFPATKPAKGSVWLIAGGPGESGASLYANLEVFRRAFPSLDIFIPDHRGTGFSSSICPEEAPESVGGKSLVGEEWASCFSHMYANTGYVQSFSISNAARDLALLMDTLSPDGKKYIYSVSYGTQLTLRLLQLSAIQPDGLILDSLVPLQDDTVYELSQRSRVVNSVGTEILALCDKHPQCQANQPLNQLLSELLKTRPMLSDYAESLPESKLSNLLGSLLDIPHLRTRIPILVKQLFAGNTALLQQTLQDINQFYSEFDKGYQNFGSSIPLVQVISSSENNLRPSLTPGAIIDEEKSLLFTSSLPGLLAGNSMPTYARDAYFAKVPQQLPATLVLHGTLDPKTHVQGAIKHVAALKSAGKIQMVKIIHAPHFVALAAPRCFESLVTDFIAQEQTLASQCTEQQLLLF